MIGFLASIIDTAVGLQLQQWPAPNSIAVFYDWSRTSAEWTALHGER